MEYIKTLNRKKIIAGIFVLILLIALPITILTVRNRQNIASLAGNPVTLTLAPTVGNVGINQTLDVQVILKAGTLSVQTAEFAVSYGQVGSADIVTAEFIPNPNSGFTALYSPAVELNNATKTLSYKTAVNVGTANITGDINLGTLKLKGVSTGTAQVNFTKGTFNELNGELTPTYVNGAYTVGTTSTGSAFPTGYKAPLVTTSLVTNPPRTFKSAVYAYGHTVTVVYRWGPVANITCQNLPNTIIGPVNITGGDAAITPNATLATNAPFPQNAVVYYCASITYGNNLAKYGQVAQFNNGNVGGTTPTPSTPGTGTPTSTLTPTNTLTPTKTPTLTQGITSGITSGVTAVVTTVAPTTVVVSPAANEASLNIAVKLPGIGSNLEEGENNNPRHTRTFDVVLFTDTNIEKKIIPTTFTYANGKYTGTTLINGIPFGVPYAVKIKTDNSLLKNIGFIIPESQRTISMDATGPDKRIAVGKLSNASAANTLSVEDYQAFINCYNNEPVCTAEYRAKADLNDDGTVDLKDRSILIRSFVRIQGD